MNLKKGLLSAATISLGLLSVIKTLPASAQSTTPGYLIQGATVTGVQNTSSNGDNFAITVTGGSGVCGNSVIVFPLTAVTNQDVHDHGYQAALTALTQNLKIDVYNYSNSSCTNGGQISIYH